MEVSHKEREDRENRRPVDLSSNADCCLKFRLSSWGKKLTGGALVVNIAGPDAIGGCVTVMCRQVAPDPLLPSTGAIQGG